MKTPERLVTLQEAAEMLGMSIKTMRRWASERRFPVVKLGRAVRVRESVLVQLQERGDQPANAAVAL